MMQPLPIMPVHCVARECVAGDAGIGLLTVEAIDWLDFYTQGGLT